ncbi:MULTISPECIES: TetR/AcrR family transcriptional regulator [Maritimibacter]|nr:MULTISPECIES: TetR/AcrR family transcriptional regulator [Maritimibacter]MBL6426533.1 TetR/AcrR family transcriptional regulator [Maritimibacter sp.]TYP80812.1 TetR family transcriptional regulator [Maritimibacter alkaliphilus HTCC2654]
MRADGLRNREAILKAAADVFARDGFVIALDRIAVEAGVGRATLYRNFSNRSVLAMAVFEQNVARFEQLAEKVSATPQGFRFMLDALAEDIAAHAALGQALALTEAESDLSDLRDRVVEVLDRFRRSGIEAGELRPDFHRDDIALLVDTLGLGLQPGDRARRAVQVARMVELFSTGISSR